MTRHTCDKRHLMGGTAFVPCAKHGKGSCSEGCPDCYQESVTEQVRKICEEERDGKN